jgi:hypothetical protein
VHFWALIFIYMWAGPHHLHYTALPDWAQSLGMVFSLILLAPSWGGMINGIMTLSGAWHKLRTDPILKFLIVSLSFYGMSTFEGPMMSIKTVNALSHYTDWTIGHVHSGALGWVAMVSIGAIYHLIPRLFGRREMYSIKLIDAALLARDHRHRALHRLDVDRRRDAGPDVARGQRRRHADLQLRRSAEGHLPVLRRPLLGGLLFLTGMLLMAYNTWIDRHAPASRRRRTRPVWRRRHHLNEEFKPMQHTSRKIEKNVGLMIVLIILPSASAAWSRSCRCSSRSRPPSRWKGLKPYTALQLDRTRHLHPRRLLQLPLADDPPVPRRDRALRPLLGGRRVRLRPPRSSGAPSAPGRTWPASAAATPTTGTAHLINPRDVVPESNMPAFPWLDERRGDAGDIQAKMRACAWLGVPYTDEEIAGARQTRGQDRDGRADRLPAGTRP